MTSLLKGSKGAFLKGVHKIYFLIAFIFVSTDELVKGAANDNCNMANLGSVIIIVKFK